MTPPSNGQTHSLTRNTIRTSAPVKSITEIITNGFFSVDHQWTVFHWSKGAEKIVGIPAAEIIGSNLWTAFAGIIPGKLYEMSSEAFRVAIPVHFEDYWASMGGWFDFVTYHTTDSVSVSFKKINESTDHTKSEGETDQIYSLNGLYQLVTEVTNDCLWEWDLTANEIFWIDGGHKRVFGYPVVDAVVPQSFWESCLHPDDKERILLGLSNKMKKGTRSVWEDEYRFKNADGKYVYVHDRGHIIYEGNKACRMIGASQDITERKLAENKLLEEILNKQREITEAVLSAQENERAEIGKELHDNLNQILSATKLYIEMAKTDANYRTIYLDKSAGYIIKVIDEIRRISKALLPPGLHFMDLLESIQVLLDDLQLIHPVSMEFDAGRLNINDLGEKLQLNIFRMIQEQVTNILKHSNATKASIHLSSGENVVQLLISDNGQGFDMSIKTTGVGLRNIKSRAELFTGKLTIASKPGAGCVLKVIFPFNSNLVPV